MIKELIMETIIQWIIFLIIPLIVYLIFFRKKTKLLSFLGLKKPEKIKSGILIKISIISIIYIAISMILLKKYNLGLDDVRVLSFINTGFSIGTILIILIQSVIRTALLEEIFFRGFLINLFKTKFGFTISNHIQAILFTGIHVLGMLSFSIVEIVMSTIAIYILSICFGKVTKESNFSIFYSFVFHALLNILAGVTLILMSI